MKLFKRKKYTITAPFDVGSIHAGDQVNRYDLFRKVSVELAERQDAIDELTEQLEEKERQLEEIQREIDCMRYDINEFYEPVNPYKYNGVSPRDF